MQPAAGAGPSILARRSPQLTNGHGRGGADELAWAEGMPLGDVFTQIMCKAWDIQDARRRESMSPKYVFAFRLFSGGLALFPCISWRPLCGQESLALRSRTLMQIYAHLGHSHAMAMCPRALPGILYAGSGQGHVLVELCLGITQLLYRAPSH